MVLEYRKIREIVGSGPDHCNEVNIAVKCATYSFWFPSASKSYGYIRLQPIKCATVLCIKKIYTLIK